MTFVGLASTIIKNAYTNIIITGMRIQMTDPINPGVRCWIINAGISSITKYPANPHRLLILVMRWMSNKIFQERIGSYRKSYKIGITNSLDHECFADIGR